MEFKYCSIRYIVSLFAILIESKWNLNYTGGFPSPNLDYILIESKWNLNRYDLRYGNIGINILIESKWNLNAARKKKL